MTTSIDLQPDIDELGSLWRRSLIAWPDGRRDTTSTVSWLQGPRLFIDLRQPIGRPGFERAYNLRRLEPVQLQWLAQQEGFAGHLQWEKGVFEWLRDIDFQPKASRPDRGTLRFEQGMLIEEGVSAPYIEHWHREATAKAPVSAMRLFDRSAGCRGFLVRVGDAFMYARDRTRPVPHGASLQECISGAQNLKEAQDFVDFEISQGWVIPSGWIIDRSTLPYREGSHLDPQFAPGRSDLCHIEDVDADGRPMKRRWEITAQEGASDAFRFY